MLREKIEAVEVARQAYSDLSARRYEFSQKLAPAERDFGEADRAVVSAMAEVELGERTAADAEKLKRARTDAADRYRGIKAAIELLEARLTEAREAMARAEHECRAEAAPLAATRAATELQRIHSLSAQLGSALRSWHRLDAATRPDGAPSTGTRQTSRTRVAEILREHGVYADAGEVVVDTPQAAAMTPTELLELTDDH